MLKVKISRQKMLGKYEPMVVEVVIDIDDDSVPPNALMQLIADYAQEMFSMDMPEGDSVEEEREESTEGNIARITAMEKRMSRNGKVALLGLYRDGDKYPFVNALSNKWGDIEEETGTNIESIPLDERISTDFKIAWSQGEKYRELSGVVVGGIVV